jgi:hypothetical protein
LKLNSLISTPRSSPLPTTVAVRGSEKGYGDGSEDVSNTSSGGHPYTHTQLGASLSVKTPLSGAEYCEGWVSESSSVVTKLSKINVKEYSVQ